MKRKFVSPAAYSVLLRSQHVLTSSGALSEHTHTAKWNLIVKSLVGMQLDWMTE